MSSLPLSVTVHFAESKDDQVIGTAVLAGAAVEPGDLVACGADVGGAEVGPSGVVNETSPTAVLALLAAFPSDLEPIQVALVG